MEEKEDISNLTSQIQFVRLNSPMYKIFDMTLVEDFDDAFENFLSKSFDDQDIILPGVMINELYKLIKKSEVPFSDIQVLGKKYISTEVGELVYSRIYIVVGDDLYQIKNKNFL